MLFNRKGESASYMGGKTTDIILALIALSVIGLVLIGIFGETDFFDEYVCKISVRLADQTEKAPILEWTPATFPIICYTKDKVIEEERKDKVMWEIVGYMKKCWDMWGEGELSAKGENVWAEDDHKCFKCYRLSFSDFEGTISAEEWEEFLEDPKNNVKGYDDSFYNYFKGNVMFNFEGGDGIEKGKFYGVTFIEYIAKDRLGRYVAAAGTGATVFGSACMFIVGIGWIASPACVAAGGVIGLTAAGLEHLGGVISDWLAGEDTDAIMFSRYEDVEDICGGFIK